MLTQENARWLSPNCPQNFRAMSGRRQGGVARGSRDDKSLEYHGLGWRSVEGKDLRSKKSDF